MTTQNKIIPDIENDAKNNVFAEMQKILDKKQQLKEEYAKDPEIQKNRRKKL